MLPTILASMNTLCLAVSRRRSSCTRRKRNIQSIWGLIGTFYAIRRRFVVILTELAIVIKSQETCSKKQRQLLN